MKLNLFLVIFGLTLGAGAGEATAQATGVLWRRIAEGLEITQVEDRRSSFLLQPHFIVLRSDLTKQRIAVVRAADYGRKRASAKQLCVASNAIGAINASFFDERGRPLGLLISRGLLYQPLHQGGKTLTGVLQVSRSGLLIKHRSDFTAQNVLEAIQTGPRLLSGGQRFKLSEGNESSKRAALCLDRQDRLLFFISAGFIGTSLTALQELMLRPGIACRDALNLDGGASAQFYLSNLFPGAAPTLPEISIPGGEEVPVVLALFPAAIRS